MTFANVHVLLLIIPEHSCTQNYRLYNFSDYDMVLVDENNHQFSKYEAVDLKQLLLIDLGLLKLINYSDNKCDQNVLQSCFEFAKKLVDMDNSEYSKLNLLQIKKRLNTLTTEDNNYLLSLMNHSAVEIRYATACILGYKEQANYLFENKFSESQRELFIEYPIYHLLTFS